MLYLMGGNKISVKALDLNIAFNNIAAQLNKIAEAYFGEVIKKEVLLIWLAPFVCLHFKITENWTQGRLRTVSE